MLINNLKVVNEVAEKGVRLMEEFNDVLTDDEEQRRMLLHSVEDTRKLFPDFRKSTSAKTSAETNAPRTPQPGGPVSRLVLFTQRMIKVP